MNLKTLFSWYGLTALGFIAIAVVLIMKVLFPQTPNWVTTQVEIGDVKEIVSVSGFVEASIIADLAFQSSGNITDVLVNEGDKVVTGALLATLASAQLVAERREATNALAAARASYAKTAAGPRAESVTVSNTNVRNAELKLEQVKLEEAKRVANSRAALLSSDLISVTTNLDEDSTPPIVSGTYSCVDEGQYDISVYSSAAGSGYSYNFTGLETGNASAGTDQPSAIGACGLFLQFIPGDIYSNSNWSIEVPNERSSSYVSLKNAYDLAKTVAQNNIASAENNLTLVRNEANLSLAPARSEDLNKDLAAIAQAEARIAAIDARIGDRSIVAPFTGTITEVLITKGETTPIGPALVLLADDAFTIKARVPEIDIIKIIRDQEVDIVFDAASSETITGKVANISPVAKQIDGVAYFEITVSLATYPTWIRAGLNADIDIITQSKEKVLRLPKRFVVTLADGSKAVLIPQSNRTATTSIEVLFTGNDSFLEIAGLPEGTVVVAP